MKLKFLGLEISILRGNRIDEDLEYIPEPKDLFIGHVNGEIEEMKTSEEPYLWLSLDDFEVEEIPDVVWGLNELKELSLICGERLIISPKISNLKNLELLSIQCHYEEESEESDFLEIVVPQEFAQLKNLKTIELHGSGIRNIPELLFVPPNIERVELWHTGLREIPLSIYNLKKLNELEVFDSRMSTISPEIGKLVELKKLILSGNGILKLPTEIGRLSNLVVLMLDENNLSSLPQSFTGLKNLERLDLSQNEFEEFPKECLFSSKLRALHIQDNPFVDASHVLEMGIHELKKYYHISTNFRLNIPKVLLTAFQQYLLFFREYVYAAKGISVNYDVFVIGGALEISIEFSESLNDNLFVEYLEEYLDFARTNSVEVINVEGNPEPNEIDLLRLNLELQVSNLSNQLKMKNWQIKYLESELEAKRLEAKEMLSLIAKDISREIKVGEVVQGDRRNVHSECLRLIKEGLIEQVFDLLFNAGIENQDYYDDLLLLSRRWKDNENNDTRGIVDSGDYRRERSKISSSLLTLIKRLNG